MEKIVLLIKNWRILIFFLLCSMPIRLCAGLGFTFSVDSLSYWASDEEPIAILKGIKNQSYTGTVNVPSTVTYNEKTYTVVGINETAFKGKYISGIVIPATVKEIGYKAFQYCANLKFVVFAPNSQLERIERATFENSGLTSITIPKSVKYIGEHAFHETQLKSIKGCEGVEIIDQSAFGGCNSLIEFTLPKSLKEIGYKAFWNCNKLRKIVINEGLETIGDGAFMQCTELAEVTIPNTVKEIRTEAFYGSLKLKSINIPNSVEKIGDRAFRYCTGLKEIIFGENLKEIGANAFEQAAIEELVIPNNVKKISAYAFLSCESLKNVVWGKSLTYIGAGAFGFTALNKVVLQEPLVTIESAAFGHCTELTEITIPSTVTSISNGAFSDSYKLKDVYNLALLPQTINQRHIFDGCNLPVNVHVYEGLKDLYESTTGWNLEIQAGTIVIIDDVPLQKATSIVIDNEPYYCKIGGEGKATATILPQNVATHLLSWSSSDESVLYIDEFSGTFFGLSEGVATITATTTDGSNLQASAIVYVSENDTMTNIGNNSIAVSGIIFDNSTLTVEVGKQDTITAIVQPDNASVKHLVWSSDNETVATVENGIVTGVSAGSATITATASDNSGVTATCAVIVNIPVKATDVTLNQTSLTLTSVGDTVTLIATVSPDSAMDKSVIWTSSNPGVATVDSNGVVTAVANGTATVTVTTADGSNKTATCEVTVTSQENEPTVDEDTDISTLQNVIYIDKVEAQSGSQMNLSIKMKNNAKIRSFQFDLYLPEGVTAVKNAKGRIMGSLTSGRLPEDDEHTLTMAVQSDGAIRFLCGSQYDETFTDTDGEIASLQVNISEYMDEGDYPIILKSIRLSETNISKFYDTPFVKTTLTISNYILGDINGDGIVNVTDYTGVANHILGFAQSGFNTKAADVNTDNVINVSDYTGVANIILSGNVYGQSNAVRAMMPTVKRTPTDLSTLNNIIYVEPMTVAKGTQATLSFQMKNNTDIRSFQFDLYLPEGVTAVTNSNGRIMASLSSGRLPEDDEHTLTMAFQPNGAIRFLCGSQYDESFTGTDGEIATLQVLISDSMNDGDYPIIIKDMRLSKTDINQYFDSDNIETTLTVGDNTVVLDENSTEVPVATSGDVNIKVKRTINANEWSTICLPFDMTESQLKEAFGEDVELSEFDSYDAEYDADDNVTSIVVNFSPVNLAEGLFANTPYIIRTKSEISEFNVTATINPDEENALVEYDNGKTGKRREVYGTFYGTYHANTIVPANALFISGNNFYYSTGLTKMKAFRAYFEFEDVLSSVDGSATIRMSMDRELTGISDVLQEAPANTYYDLQGRRVLRPSKGVYIYQGKKIYVK